MKSRNPRTALTGVPSSAVTSGTPKNARKYIDAESRTISRCWLATGGSLRIRSARDARVVGVEDLDRTIVRLLGADGRMSFTDLGKATGLSTSAVHQRVKRLEKRGVISGYGAAVNHEELGLALTAFVSITPIDPSQPDDYPERIRGIHAIESCWSVAGDESYILKVRVETPHALEDLLARIRSDANVSTRTTIVLSTPYENRTVTE
jgi:Lrp/AsnC family transcriptional regulator, leucine-responsive regulatory protein